MRFTPRLIPAALLVGIGLAARMPAAHARHQDPDSDTKCGTNLKTIGLAMLMYVQDYDEVLPPTKNPAHLRKVLEPYLKDRTIFTCPATGADYKCNPYVSTIPVKEIKSPGTIPFYFDAKPHADGLYRVVYLDGHMKPESQAPVVKPIARAPHSKSKRHKS